MNVKTVNFNTLQEMKKDVSLVIVSMLSVNLKQSWSSTLLKKYEKYIQSLIQDVDCLIWNKQYQESFLYKTLLMMSNKRERQLSLVEKVKETRNVFLFDLIEFAIAYELVSARSIETPDTLVNVEAAAIITLKSVVEGCWSG